METLAYIFSLAAMVTAMAASFTALYYARKRYKELKREEELNLYTK